MAASVLIVDDHASFRALARTLLEAAGYVVVGEAADGASALAAAATLRPAIVLLDVQLPKIRGLPVSTRLAAATVLRSGDLNSSRDRLAYRRSLADTPARGFLAKSELSGPALAALLG